MPKCRICNQYVMPGFVTKNGCCMECEKRKVERTDMEQLAAETKGFNLPKQDKKNGYCLWSPVSIFFAIIAIIIWGLGLAVAISTINNQHALYSQLNSLDLGINKLLLYDSNETKHRFLLFILAFKTYFLYGCLSICIAEFFRILQGILNMLKATNERMSKW